MEPSELGLKAAGGCEPFGTGLGGLGVFDLGRVEGAIVENRVRKLGKVEGDRLGLIVQDDFGVGEDFGPEFFISGIIAFFAIGLLRNEGDLGEILNEVRRDGDDRLANLSVFEVERDAADAGVVDANN